jgi:nucleoid-associated protein YgaU
MNKEVKIGLSVILVLIVVLVSAVAWRFYRYRAAEQVSAAEDKDAETSDATAKAEKETSGTADKVKIANASAGRPKVIAAKSMSGKPPENAAGDDDLWNTRSDSGRKRVSAGGGSDLKQRPSYMPDPPRGDVEDRYNRYKNEDRTATAKSREQEEIPRGTVPYSSIRKSGQSQADAADYRNDSRRRRATAPAASGGRTYTVAEGDSLFDIARNELGKASRWVEIYDLNADVLGKDIDNLTPGTRIVLPDDNAQQAAPLSRYPTMR